MSMPNRRLNDQWCRDHWRPYRQPNSEGIRPNGIFAATALMQAFIDHQSVRELADKSPAALNRFMADSKKPVCCRLGDETMNQILKDAIACGTRDAARRNDGT